MAPYIGLCKICFFFLEIKNPLKFNFSEVNDINVVSKSKIFCKIKELNQAELNQPTADLPNQNTFVASSEPELQKFEPNHLPLLSNRNNKDLNHPTR